MSIAESLERTIRRMEAVWKRDNGDFDKVFPDLVDDARHDIARVAGLESVSVITTDTLKAFQEKEAN